MAITDRLGRTVGSIVPGASETDPQAGLAIKTPVRVCTTANIVLNGLLTVDGVALAAGDRVLVRNQSDSTQDGIYTVSTGNWTRTTDFDNLGEVVKGTQVYINEGTLYGARSSYVTASDPVTPGTSALTFSAPTAGVIAGTAVVIAGNTLSADIASQAAALAGVSNTTVMTPLRVAQALAAGGSVSATMAQLLAGTAGTFASSQLLFQLLIADSLIQNNILDANNDIDVLLDGSAVVTKRLDAVWAAGTNQGGLDTGAKANSTSYHIYLITKNSDATLDAIFSASATAPTIPSGWTKVRVLGAVMTNGSGNIKPFLQSGGHFELLTHELEANGFANPASPATTRTLTGVPHGVKMVAELYVEGSNSTSTGGYLNVWDADLGISVTTTGALYAVVVRQSGVPLAGALITCMTSATGQICTSDNASAGTSTLLMVTRGWFDPRVRHHAV